MTHGRFISFEGGEGSGKSTHVGLLGERLRTRGVDVLQTREPGGSPFGERLRNLLLDPAVEPHAPTAETLLFYAARADHLDRVIRPALKAGSWVICDRFSDSTRVYQGYAGAVRLQFIEGLELLVVTPTKPDLTFVIDIPSEIGLGRAAVRETANEISGPAPFMSGGRDRQAAQGLLADRYQSRNLDFHQQVREGFLKIAEMEPDRCVVINGRRTRDEVADDIWKAVEGRLLGEVG